MQTDNILSYVFPFFISIATWIKMLHYKKYMRLIFQDYNYILTKLENLDTNIDKNKGLIFDIDKQIGYLDESMFNLKNQLNNSINNLNNSVSKNINDIENIETRISSLDKIIVKIYENAPLKIINPNVLFKDNTILTHNNCQSPYNILYTSSTKSTISTLSPDKKHDWVNIACEENNCN